MATADPTPKAYDSVSVRGLPPCPGLHQRAAVAYDLPLVGEGLPVPPSGVACSCPEDSRAMVRASQGGRTSRRCADPDGRTQHRVSLPDSGEVPHQRHLLTPTEGGRAVCSAENEDRGWFGKPDTPNWLHGPCYWESEAPAAVHAVNSSGIHRGRCPAMVPRSSRAHTARGAGASIHLCHLTGWHARRKASARTSHVCPVAASSYPICSRALQSPKRNPWPAGVIPSSPSSPGRGRTHKNERIGR